MRVYKCDHCKKTIGDNSNVVLAGFGLWAHHQLCRTCGFPVIKLLEKYKLTTTTA